MEIIGRFPTVALCEPADALPDPHDLPEQPVPAAAAPRRPRRFPSRKEAAPPVAFPVRSVAALTVLAAGVWVLALHNDAARRRAVLERETVTIAADSREGVAK